MIVRSLVRIYESPRLRKPVLIEGFPGIGLVANLAAYHLIKRLNACKFCDLRSPYFKPLAVIGKSGVVKYPLSSLYYVHTSAEAENDLIVLYGNTQPITFAGQSELAETVLDITLKLGCETVITLGGLSTVTPSKPPKVYYAASHPDLASRLEKMGLMRLSGRVYGEAGVLIGLAKIRGMRGICLLGEVKGVKPSPEPAGEVLKVLSRLLGLSLDLSGLESHLDEVREKVAGLG